MSEQILSTPIKLPRSHQENFRHMENLTRRVANHILKEYWNEEHLVRISEHEGRAWKYFNEGEAFDDVGLYLPSRFKRCILQKVGETLRSQTSKLRAFQKIKPLLPEKALDEADKRQIRKKIYEDDEFIDLGEVSSLLKRIDNYYREHGRYPDSYLDLQDCPRYKGGTLPYSADDGPEKGQMVRYGRDGEFKVKIKLPETASPEVRGDWGWFDVNPDVHEHFHRLTKIGELKAPEFYPKDRKTGERFYYLNFPVEVEELDENRETGRILSVDLGTKKLAACTVLNEDGEQLSKPHFIRSSETEKMRRLYYERNDLNSKLGNLRKHGLAHTHEFKHLQAEYKRTQNKLNHKREQLQHSVANQLLSLAIYYEVDAVVFENLGGLEAPRGHKTTSWIISSWARGMLKDKVEYRGKIAGIGVEFVPAWGTSRTCPRCGERGETVKAPDIQEKDRSGGHFKCKECGYQADRDYVGALNVGRKYLGNGHLKEAKPVAYTESGNTPGDRSLGVRPASFEAEKGEEPSSHPSRIVPPHRTLIDGGDEPRLGGKPKGIVQLVEDY